MTARIWEFPTGTCPRCGHDADSSAVTCPSCVEQIEARRECNLGAYRVLLRLRRDRRSSRPVRRVVRCGR